MIVPFSRLIGMCGLGLVLQGCGDPLAGIERIEDVDVAENQALELAAEPEAVAETGGFLSRILARVAADEQTADVEQNVTEPSTELASLAPDAETDSTVVSDAPAAGRFLGKLFATPAADATGPVEVEQGTVLPYGTIAKICSGQRRELGRKVAKYPERGGKYTLFDSNPDTTAPHTFYLTGFSDGCVRQFTAALAVFGEVSMHEQLRYGLPSNAYPYSDTDTAYEKIKARVCGVSKKKPCGGQISKLERDTVFLSTYEHFGDNARWSDILIHDGRIEAAALKAY